MQETDAAVIFQCGHVYHTACLDDSDAPYCHRCQSIGLPRGGLVRTSAARAPAPSAAAGASSASTPATPTLPARPPASAAGAARAGTAADSARPALSRAQLRSLARLRAALSYANNVRSRWPTSDV